MQVFFYAAVEGVGVGVEGVGVGVEAVDVRAEGAGVGVEGVGVGVSVTGGRMPRPESRRATRSVGCAPRDSHSRTRSSLISNVVGVVSGL